MHDFTVHSSFSSCSVSTATQFASTLASILTGYLLLLCRSLIFYFLLFPFTLCCPIDVTLVAALPANNFTTHTSPSMSHSHRHSANPSLTLCSVAAAVCPTHQISKHCPLVWRPRRLAHCPSNHLYRRPSLPSKVVGYGPGTPQIPDTIDWEKKKTSRRRKMQTIQSCVDMCCYAFACGYGSCTLYKDFPK
jgi:hypothetical protein